MSKGHPYSKGNIFTGVEMLCAHNLSAPLPSFLMAFCPLKLSVRESSLIRAGSSQKQLTKGLNMERPFRCRALFHPFHDWRHQAWTLSPFGKRCPSAAYAATKITHGTVGPKNRTHGRGAFLLRSQHGQGPHIFRHGRAVLLAVLRENFLWGYLDSGWLTLFIEVHRRKDFACFALLTVP